MKMIDKQKKILENAVSKGYYLSVTDEFGEVLLTSTNKVDAVVSTVENMVKLMCGCMAPKGVLGIWNSPTAC